MASKAFERLLRVSDTQTLRLTHHGRKSGKPYEVTIWFVVDTDKMYLPTANANRNWVRNVKAHPTVLLHIADQTFTGDVRPVTDQRERDHVSSLLERKYWYMFPMLRLARFLFSMGIMTDNSAAFEVILSDS